MHDRRVLVTFNALPAVFLPGTGSDADFARRALGPGARLLGAAGITAVTPGPDLVGDYLRALDAAARAAHGPLLLGGVSIGAMVAAQWALRHPGAAAGVIAAMPAWCGAPDGSPAAASAAITAGRVAGDGLEPTITAMRDTSPRWLGDELARSWRCLGSALAPSMRAAAAYRAPEAAELAALDVPLGIVGVIDDPLHPIAVARAWHAHAPRSGLTTISLDELGRDPAVLGTAGAAALEIASGPR